MWRNKCAADMKRLGIRFKTDSFQLFDSFFWETITLDSALSDKKNVQAVFIHLELCSKIHNRGTLNQIIINHKMHKHFSQNANN